MVVFFGKHQVNTLNNLPPTIDLQTAENCQGLDFFGLIEFTVVLKY